MCMILSPVMANDTGRITEVRTDHVVIGTNVNDVLVRQASLTVEKLQTDGLG